jgi:SAM-dependent MidA family methyltransferase
MPMTVHRPFDPPGLPAPDAAARAHGERVLAMIHREIDAAGGCIDFARYMDLALHAPGLGYYSAGSTKFGAAGDFVTAPELSPLFAACLARQVAEVLAAMGGGAVMEIGAGSGALAMGLLAELERLGAAPERYLILETSAELRERQAASLRQAVPAAVDRVEWVDRLPDGGFRGIMLANELLDAMPVHRLLRDSSGALLEACVRREGAGLEWGVREPGNARLAERVDAIVAGLDPVAFESGYCFEINLAMEGWLASAAAALESGMLLLVDYGYPRREYYHPERRAGTLMCHYRHRAHGDPLVLPGLQDITAHIDFTALAEAGWQCGLDLCGYTTQAWFLFGCGLQELAAQRMSSASTLDAAKIAQQVQRLTLPGEMGEKFKVIAWRREVAIAPSGFALRDERYRL